MNESKHNCLIILLSIVIVAIVTLVFLAFTGCHPTWPDGYMLWFAIFYGGFLLLGL